MHDSGISQEMIDEAKRNPNGWVYKIDCKYPDGDNIPQKLLKEHGESMSPERFLEILLRTIVTGLLKNQEEYFQNLCV